MRCRFGLMVSCIVPGGFVAHWIAVITCVVLEEAVSLSCYVDREIGSIGEGECAEDEASGSDLEINGFSDSGEALCMFR